MNNQNKEYKVGESWTPRFSIPRRKSARDFDLSLNNSEIALNKGSSWEKYKVIIALIK